MFKKDSKYEFKISQVIRYRRGYLRYLLVLEITNQEGLAEDQSSEITLVPDEVAIPSRSDLVLSLKIWKGPSGRLESF